ncbi:hypothetical protein T4B_6646 [Trichinella pseudospiralis]|uniref:Uncharacterized protein n=2 Tax=Trichinella pseudospiralis TaxID=6337 RepID=A0A0V1DXM1_TRIPS|nr:hypothetical protein T4A_9086 [Trichinella pseudospiralis]KRY84287.1 hypothetical protein T4D_2211 [Trichinella pseudospiralis]KRZ20610.1 hypothetical protein T4B_6646 [Trichinella pseudospiralis]KRZ35847.1 hypothetical protein T4C_12084 [Trichinella pseudospiralis]
MDRMEQCFHIFESSPPTEKYDVQKKRISDIIVELERAYHFDAWHTITEDKETDQLVRLPENIYDLATVSSI